MSHKTPRWLKNDLIRSFYATLTNRAAILDLKLRVPQSFRPEVQTLAEGSDGV